MDAAIIGLLGALFGVMLTYVFNRRNAVAMRLHESRIDAYKLFASSLMDYRRAVMDQWFEDHSIHARTEDDDVHRARSAAWSAYYGVRLLTSNDTLGNEAKKVLESITDLKDVKERRQLNAEGERCRVEVEKFVEAARIDVASSRRWKAL